MAKGNAVNGLNSNFTDLSKFKKCEGYISSKQTELQYEKHNIDRSLRPLHLVHTDLVVINQKGRNGEFYILTFMDNFTFFKAAYCMKRKSGALFYLNFFLNFAHANCNLRVS